MLSAPSPLDTLYREVVLEHHRHPQGLAPLARVDASARGHNPGCGDEVELTLTLDGDRIVDVGVHTRGCAIATAAGSMLAERLRGQRLDEAAALDRAFTAALHGATALPDVELGDLEALRGVGQFPQRVKCALLPWTTLREALRGTTAGVAPAEAPDGAAAESP